MPYLTPIDGNDWIIEFGQYVGKRLRWLAWAYYKEAQERDGIMDIGGRMKSLMEKRGIGIRELSRRSGVSIGYIWQLLHQPKKSPGVAILVALAESLGCIVDDLLYDNTGSVVAWDEAHVLSCARCRLTEGLNMFAHRDRKDRLVGFMFLCKGCASLFSGGSVKIKFDRKVEEAIDGTNDEAR